jgi:hypothetical protein
VLERNTLDRGAQRAAKTNKTPASNNCIWPGRLTLSAVYFAGRKDARACEQAGGRAVKTNHPNAPCRERISCALRPASANYDKSPGGAVFVLRRA